MTLAVGGVPSAQLSAVPSTPSARPPTPPLRHYSRRHFLIPKVPPLPHTSLSMETNPTSALPSHLPASPQVFSSSSPSPPPPPPSYLISELPPADLPPPPPLALWQDMASRRYMCCYDPPSPEVKSEYDPQLPPGFFSAPDIFPSSPPPPPIPPPPRPSLPPPPTPPIRRPSGDSSHPRNAATFNIETDHPESVMESGGYEEEAFETSSTISLVSSSTVTATYFQTPDSATSPLPPHAFRVSPLSTDAVTISSRVSIDSLTPSSDISFIPSLFSISQEYSMETSTSDFVPQVSVITDATCDVPVLPGFPFSSLATDSKLEHCESSTQAAEINTRKESFKSESGSSVPSVVSYTTNDTAGPAVMSSPLSTDVLSLPSLPTDPDSVSSGLGSLTTDTWSLSTEVDSQAGDESVVRTKTSGSSSSDAAYATAASGTASPAFTSSCTITPMPTDYLTPHFRSPTLTPLTSPIPSSPLPHFEAVHLSNKPQCSSGLECIITKETASPELLQLDIGGVMSASLEPLQTANGGVTSAPLEHLQTADELTSVPPEPLQAAGGGMTTALLEPLQTVDGVTSAPPEPLQADDEEIISVPPEQFQAADGVTAPLSDMLPKQPGHFDHNSSHNSNELAQRHSSLTLTTDISQSSSSQVNEQCTTQIKSCSGFVSPNRHTENTEESSGSINIFLDRMPSSPDNSYVSERVNDGIKIKSYGMPPIPVSVSNGRFSDQITEAKRNVVIGEEEEQKARKTDESGKRDSVYENEDKDYVGKDHEEGVTYVDECRENLYSQVAKDVNGNISYLEMRNAGKAQLENKEEIGGWRSEVLKKTETLTVESLSVDTIHPAEGTLGRQVEGHENVSPEDVGPLLSPVSSLTCPHMNGSGISSLPDIPPNEASHSLVSLHPEPSLSNCNERDDLFLCSGTSSTIADCSLVSPIPKPLRGAQVSSSSKDAIELLDAVVVTLENLSADLPVSPTLRAPEFLPSESEPVTELRMTDQPLTQNLEICGKLSTEEHQSHDTNNKDLKVAVCHLPLLSSSHDSLPHPTPLSPTLLSQSSVSTASLLHVGVSASHGEPSQCVSSPCPSPTTNIIHPACSVSPSFWNVPHTDPESLHSSCSLDDHTKKSALVKDAREVLSEEGVHFRPCTTDFQDSLPMVCEMPSPSLHSSPQTGSLLDGQPSSSPAPRSRTPPTPPPRSCHNTPRTSLAPPLPPPRQYMLVPINQPLGVLQQPSPPPAPPRSTSVHRVSPPPPPRPSVPRLPLPVQQWNEGPPLPPPPVLSSHTTPLQPSLTPVPEESSTPQSPVHSRSPQLNSPISDGAPPTVIPLSDPLPSQKLPPKSSSYPSCSSDDAPALPPPPEDEQDEEEIPPPPPPPPPIESEDEMAPPLPLPPPPPDVLLSPPSPISPLQGKVEPSTPLCSIQMPALPDLCVANSHTDLSSTPSSDPDPPPPAVDDIAILPSTKHPNVTASQKSPMPNSQAVDASAAPPPPPIPGAPHAPPSSLPEPPCAPPLGPNTGEATKPSLITTSPYGKMVVVRSDLPLPSPEEEVRIAFNAAKDWGFLREGEDTLSVYTQLRPVIQQGPQCGLVALSMASQVFPQTVEVEELLAAGQTQGVTRHGEMFNATKLARLAEKAVPGLQAEVRRDVLSNPATLLQLLLQGDLVLVPYDAERNHQPGLKEGHKAHWGVVCGCLVQSHALTFPTTTAKLDSHVDQLWHLRPRSRAGRSRSITPCTPTLPASSKIGQRSLRTPDGVSAGEGTSFSISCSRVNTPMLADLWNDEELKLVPLWRQGKSRKVVAAPLDQLCESNDQLMSYPPPSTPHEAEYVVESVQDGLAGQVVVLHKTKVALSDLVGLLQEK